MTSNEFINMNDIHSTLVKKWFFPLSQRLRGCNYQDKLDEARKNLSLSREEIRHLQFKKLSQLLHHSYLNVPYYRDSFNHLGIKPEDIRSWDDFKKLPILSKSEVREHNQRFLSEKPRTPLRKYRTGGSTGTPLKVFTSETAIAAEYACRFRAFDYWGIEIGDRLVQIWGQTYNIDTSISGHINKMVYKPVKNLLFNRREIPTNTFGEKDLEKQWNFLKKFKPAYIRAYPSALYLLAQYIIENNYDGHSLVLKLIITGAEILYDWQQETFEDIFGCSVMNG